MPREVSASIVAVPGDRWMPAPVRRRSQRLARVVHSGLRRRARCLGETVIDAADSDKLADVVAAAVAAPTTAMRCRRVEIAVPCRRSGA